MPGSPDSTPKRRWTRLQVVSLACAALGTWLRVDYALFHHHLRHRASSDALAYLERALELLQRGAVPNLPATIWPPGTSALWAVLSAMDPSQQLSAAWNAAASILVMPLTAAFAGLLAGPRAGWIALAIAALHPGFIHYNGFALAEQPFQLATAVAMYLTLSALVRLESDPQPVRIVARAPASVAAPAPTAATADQAEPPAPADAAPEQPEPAGSYIQAEVVTPDEARGTHRGRLAPPTPGGGSAQGKWFGRFQPRDPVADGDLSAPRKGFIGRERGAPTTASAPAAPRRSAFADRRVSGPIGRPSAPVRTPTRDPEALKRELAAQLGGHASGEKRARTRESANPAATPADVGRRSIGVAEGTPGRQAPPEAAIANDIVKDSRSSLGTEARAAAGGEVGASTPNDGTRSGARSESAAAPGAADASSVAAAPRAATTSATNPDSAAATNPDSAAATNPDSATATNPDSATATNPASVAATKPARATATDPDSAAATDPASAADGGADAVTTGIVDASVGTGSQVEGGAGAATSKSSLSADAGLAGGATPLSPASHRPPASTGRRTSAFALSGTSSLWIAGACIGCSWTLAALLRPNALPVAVVGAIGLLIFSRRTLPARALPVALGAVLAGVVVLSAAAHRCTTTASGRFCLVSNNVAMNVALGQAGSVYGLEFRDPQHPELATAWVPPSLLEHGYKGLGNVPASVYDAPGVFSWVAGRFAEDPIGFSVRAIGNAFDLFNLGYWPDEFGRYSERAALVLRQAWSAAVFIPALFALVVLGSQIIRSQRRPAAIFVFGAVAGLLLGAASSLGESRYRIPFDGLLIALASAVYARAQDWSAPGFVPADRLGARHFIVWSQVLALSVVAVIGLTHPELNFGLIMPQRSAALPNRGTSDWATAADFAAPRTTGSPWSAAGNYVWKCGPDCGELRIRIPKRSRARHVNLSVDHNDRYRLLFYRGGELQAFVDVPPAAGIPTGLQTARIAIPAPARSGIDAIGVQPLYGDGGYSLGHLILE